MKTEDLKVDRDDLKFKVEDFESGKSNILLVTGFAGSGKTTLADELAEKYDALHFQLDWFTEFMFGETTMEELEEQDEIGLIEYIKTNNLEGGQDYDSFEESEIVTMIRDYIKFLINWCKEQDGKFIIEGLSLYDIFQEGDDFITSCPMIIKGTSAETATRRAAKRNVEVDPETNEEDWYQELIKFADADDKKLQALERELGLAEDFAAYDQMWEDLKNTDKKCLTENCTFPFTKEDLDKALDMDDTEEGILIGSNTEDRSVMYVDGEPYGNTDWRIDKWASNLYIVSSELWGKHGAGPEEGVEEEFDSIDEVWDYLSQREQLDNIPNLKNLLTEDSIELNETSHLTKLAKPTPEEYFKNITQSKEEVIKFLKEKLGPQTKIKPNGYFDISSSYARVLARETSGNHVEIGKNLNYNYKAFTRESSKFGLFASNILHYIKTGELYLSVAFTEWLDNNGKRVTSTGGALPLFELATGICDGCACVVDPVYCLFYEPYHLINKHKLCDTCLAEWIKLPKGFVDKFLLVGNYNNIDGQIDEFIENLKLEQQDIDNMINEWNKRKKAGLLGLNNRTISTAESDFCNSATLLHLTANKADFI